MAFKHMPMSIKPEGVTNTDCMKNENKYLLKISEK